MELVVEFRGEETVVFLIIGRIAWAFLSESSNAYFTEVIALILLTVAAFWLETISKGRTIQNLKARSGAASGVLLGTMTWPMVFAAHLIHCSQIISKESIDRVKGDFWVAVACSIRCLYLMARELLMYEAKETFQEDLTKPDLNRTLCYLNFAHGMALLFSFYVLSCSLSGISGAMVVACGFLQVWGCTRVFDHIFSKFPGSATPGEGMLVAGGLTFYAGNAAFYGMCKVMSLVMPFTSSGVVNSSGDDIDAVLQALLLALLLVPSLYGILSEIMVFKGSDSKVVNKYWKKRRDVYKTLNFFVVLSFVVLVLAPWWLYVVRGLKQHLFLRICELVLQQPWERLSLCMYWVVILGVSLAYIYEVAKTGKTHRIIVRKYYHLVAVIMFVPAIILQPNFLRLAFGVALAAFLVIEMTRALKIPPVGGLVQDFVKNFIDERDTDLLIVSHFSLLVGCAVPLWLNLRHEHQPLASFAGVLSLGIGDTMASVVGHSIGSWRLTRYSKKTLEGTLAGILAVLVACFLLIQFLPCRSFTTSQWSSLIFATVCSGLVEAYTTQLDNLFVPLIFYALLSL